MSSILPMEFNAKRWLQWDWENPAMFSAMATDDPKETPTTVGEGDEDRCFEPGSLYFSDVANGSASSGSDFGLAPLTNPIFTGSEANQENTCCEKSFAANLATVSKLDDALVGPGEPFLTLKLGKRAYFDGAGTESRTKSSPGISTSSATSKKRSKSISQSVQVRCCQVEGCNLDLSLAKDYHRKHRVCENHSKCPRVIVDGLERRFCQQCSRFHEPAEFDEKKRSCRRRLSDHNARRRKPRPEPMQLNNATGMLSSYTGETQQIPFSWNGVPPTQARLLANDAWGGSSSSTLMRDPLLKMTKLVGIDVMHGQHANGVFSSAKDCEESIITSNVEASPDLHRALSLLSKEPWDLSDP